MAKPRQFNLLMMRDDGSRVLRLSVPGWVVGAVLGGLAVTVVGLAIIYPDYLTLRHERGAFAALASRLHAQQRLLDATQARMREIRGEIESWRDLHAKIWEPFGPEVGPGKSATGIGGGSPSGSEDKLGVKDDMDQLLGVVREEGKSIRSLEHFLGRASHVLASLPSRWPVRGPVNSEFGERRSPWAPNSEFHSGIDIGAAVGTPVKAPAPGVVVFAGEQPEYGITLIIDHGHDTKSLYGHLSRLKVAVNDHVQRGDTIALTGNTGRSSGPHLHYEIQVKGQPVNPLGYIWEEPDRAVAQAPSR